MILSIGGPPSTTESYEGKARGTGISATPPGSIILTRRPKEAQRSFSAMRSAAFVGISDML